MGYTHIAWFQQHCKYPKWACCTYDLTLYRMKSPLAGPSSGYEKSRMNEKTKTKANRQMQLELHRHAGLIEALWLVLHTSTPRQRESWLASLACGFVQARRMHTAWCQVFLEQPRKAISEGRREIRVHIFEGAHLHCQPTFKYQLKCLQTLRKQPLELDLEMCSIPHGRLGASRLRLKNEACLPPVFELMVRTSEN